MLRSSIFGKVRKVIETYHMIRSGDRVLVAVSGGPDSVALLAVLNKLAPELGVSLAVAHLNHGLRTEADDEERFVRDLCLSMNLEIESERADIHALSRSRGKSPEDVAREVRYAFLDRAAIKMRSNRIALGHHRRDQAETVLMNLLRGSGPEGLKGMTPVRDQLYIRPLIHTGRDEIMDFLAGAELPFALDCSNEDKRYFRNRIRHHLLPMLEGQYNAAIERTLAKTAEITGLEDDYMQSQISRILSDWQISDKETSGVCLEISKLKSLHEALARRLVKGLLERFSPDDKGVFFSHIQAVLRLAFLGKPSGRLHLPFDVEVKRDYGRLLFYRREGSGEGFTYCYLAEIPGRINIRETNEVFEFSMIDAGQSEVRELIGRKGRPERKIETGRQSSGRAYLDYERLALPLMVRSGYNGDRVRPLGMEGTKKVKEIFIDNKISRDDRRRIPLLVDTVGILWITGLCLNETARITEGTRRVLKVTYSQDTEKSIEIPERLL